MADSPPPASGPSPHEPTQGPQPDRTIPERARDNGEIRESNQANSHSGPFDTTLLFREGDGRSTPPPFPESPDCTFGGFQLLELIARGGMGIVYKARERKLNRTVAVKMILAGQLASNLDVQRFYQEAGAAAQLDHSGIVRIFGVGEHEGNHYYSMAYVEGGSLAAQIRDKPLPPEVAAEMVEQVARAVQYAHEHGIIHRDIKPSNILLDKDGRPKVSDFGLAKRLADDSQLTTSGQIVGTAPYMAPEQAAGKTDEVGRCTDIYALGALLYTLVTGRPPFHAATTIETLRQVLDREPVSPRHVNPAVNRDLATICLKCLQKQPSKRYASAGALADDLSRWLAGEPIEARPVGGVERMWRWCRRNRVVAFLLMILVLLLLSGSAVSTYFGFQAQSGEKWALAEKVRADGEAETAKHNEQEAKKQKRVSDLHAYLAEISLAYQEWKDGRIVPMEQRLDALRPTPGEPDLRSFEWHYLQRLNHLELQAIDGHQSAIWSLAYSPDGKWLATAGGSSEAGGKPISGELRIFEVASGKQVRELPAPGGFVWSIAYSPDGSRLASSGMDGKLRIWDVSTGRLAMTLAGHTGGVLSLAYSRDGKHLASGDRSGAIKLWDAASGKELKTILAHTQPILSLAFSSDSRWLVSGSAGLFRDGDLPGELALWDVPSGRQVRVFAGHRGWIRSVAFSSDGLLASGSTDRTVRVWKPDEERTRMVLQGHSAVVNCVAFSPDGQHLASGGGDNLVKFWDVRTGEEDYTVRGHPGRVHALAFSPDGWRLASAGADSTVKLWDARTSPERLVLRAPRGSLPGLALSDDGHWVATGNDRSLLIWNANTGQLARTLSGHKLFVSCLAFSADGCWLASAASMRGDVSGPAEIKVWKVGTWEEVRSLRGTTGRATSVALSPDGRQLALASENETVLVWSLAEDSKALVLSGHSATVNAVTFSPDGAFLASASNDQTVMIWSLRDSGPPLVLRGHQASVICVAFSSDGSRIASTDQEGMVHIWDAGSGEKLLTLRGQHAYPGGIAFSPDGRRIATLGKQNEHSIKIWDATTGREVLALNAGEFYELPSGLAFSRDGLRLATGHRSVVQLWDATPLTPDLRNQRVATSFVRFLQGQSLSQADLLARIRGEGTISDAVRQKALTLIEQGMAPH